MCSSDLKELLTAPEAPVQWIFIYQPLANRLIDHAQQLGEPEALIARARRTLRQPGDSARHDDHMHVRIYCSATDRAYGCVDIGPMESLAEREAEPPPVAALMAALATPAASPPAVAAAAPLSAMLPVAPDAAADAASGATATTATTSAIDAAVPQRLGRLLRTRTDHLSLRAWH